MSADALAVAAAPVVDKRAQVERLLCDIFSLMQYPATLDFQDATDGALAVAVHFQGEVPGVQAGKKSSLVDSIQFLVNKAVNRPNTERRWVTLGVGGFPEPRPAQGQRQPAVQAVPSERPAARGAAPGAGPQQRPQRQAQAARPALPARPSRPSTPASVDEASLQVPVDPTMERLGKLLAEKAVKFGRHYAVLKTSPEERAQLLQASKGIAGVTVKTEGESYLKRLAFVAQKPTPMPKMTFSFPVDLDDEE